MNNRTNTITYTDKQGRIIMRSFPDWQKGREDKAISIACAGIVLAIWIVAAVTL